MSSRGPGGRIPNKGGGPQAKGVGRNAKRHDLETQATPGLAGSDLQQGDVQALEQGQRIAPAQTQRDARAPVQTGGSGSPAGAQGGPDLSNPMSVMQSAIGGTAQTKPQGPIAPPDQGKRSRAEAWIGFHTMLAQHPQSSPLYKAQVQQQLRETIRAQSFSPTVGGALFMRDTDEALEMMARGDLRSS